MAEQPNNWKIVVGVDGSPQGDHALAWAVGVARSFQAEVVAVHAVGLLESAHAPGGSDASKDLVDRLAHAVQHHVDRIANPPAVRLVLEPGSPGDALLRVAEAERADLIVVGRRGSGEPYQLDLGSTSRSVAGRSPVPIVVVPAPKAAPH